MNDFLNGTIFGMFSGIIIGFNLAALTVKYISNSDFKKQQLKGK
jgi:hypothetical protein